MIKYYVTDILTVLILTFLVTCPLIFVAGLLTREIGVLTWHPAYILASIF
jgi:hypothetical protein